MVLLLNLIPYFLTAQIPVQNGRVWIKNAECTYSVKADFSASSEKEDINFGTNITTKLRCRPKGNDALSCRMDDLNAINFENKKNKHGIELERVRDPNAIETEKVSMGNVPFEIKFHKRGISHLVVPNGNYSSDWKLDMIRYTANLFNLGTDFAKSSQGTFNDKEDFFLGQCAVKFDLKREPRGKDEENFDGKLGFQLKVVENRDGSDKKTLSLRKERILDDCSSFAPHLFGLNEMKSIMTHVDIDYIYSKGDFIITEKSFESSIDTKMDILSKNKIIPKMALMEKLSMKLESIHQATDEFPVIKDPMMASLRLSSDLKKMQVM